MSEPMHSETTRRLAALTLITYVRCNPRFVFANDLVTVVNQNNYRYVMLNGQISAKGIDLRDKDDASFWIYGPGIFSSDTLSLKWLGSGGKSEDLRLQFESTSSRGSNAGDLFTIYYSDSLIWPAEQSNLKKIFFEIKQYA